ncbi:hypothetical protein ACOSP7_006990 [Xanthoceras sorbifolium]|uniref:Cystatin domain-containing protein n=1 Tax=Xanthoceras sorbifolium TaxID=99658 RepID=A0ABQ8I9P4_9ROSI|nr:hypothetical protein JRO89_XS03G0129100 [Xanthoceras sorbifolium]
MGKSSRAVLLLLILSLLSLCTIASVSGHRGEIVGGKTEVENVKNNKEVQELGRFSVEEFNRRQSRRRGGNNVYGDLVFSMVTEAEKQVVSGMKYYMKIDVGTKSGERKTFDSVVVVKPWLHSKELLNFAPHHN